MKWATAMAILAMIAFTSTITAADDSVVKIGALYNLTGGMSPIDSPACKGSLLAAKLLNENGGIRGKTRIDIVVIDTETDLKNAQKAAQKLVSVPVVACLGYGDTDSVLAAAPVFQRHRIPFISTGATDPDLPKKVGSFMFMTPFGDDDQAFAMAEFAFNTLKARNAVLWIDESTDFTRILAKYFKQRFIELGGVIVDEERFTTAQEEFSEAIERVKKSARRPDVVFVSGNPEDAVPTVRALRESGIELPILSGDGFDANLLSRLSNPQHADGVYFATHAYFGSQRREVRDFVNAYRDEYGEEPENSYAALGFDALNLLAEAVGRAKELTGPSIARALGQTKHFEGVTGAISFSRPSRVPVVPVGIVGIKNGEYYLEATWTP